ncbi:hypothetical protein R1sor_002117 [Riccia sorocarpa]|uniref:Uncharacterized protein n=1 Tax=Riccia sorocarpa TaxID=122646 RepID=A0ABD3H0Z6_9MARC
MLQAGEIGYPFALGPRAAFTKKMKMKFYSAAGNAHRRGTPQSNSGRKEKARKQRSSEDAESRFPGKGVKSFGKQLTGFVAATRVQDDREAVNR